MSNSYAPLPGPRSVEQGAWGNLTPRQRKTLELLVQTRGADAVPEPEAIGKLPEHWWKQQEADLSQAQQGGGGWEKKLLANFGQAALAQPQIAAGMKGLELADRYGWRPAGAAAGYAVESVDPKLVETWRGRHRDRGASPE